jgi:hypothetical protein
MTLAVLLGFFFLAVLVLGNVLRHPYYLYWDDDEDEDSSD